MTLKRQRKSPQHRGPGRPSQDIRTEYVRTELYLSLQMREALDRLAD